MIVKKIAQKGWIEGTLEDLLDYRQPTAYIVESTDYNDDYKVPVLTAGKSFIKGYTNENKGIFRDLPVIIFDDFTTANKFVNFPFKVKSSAMKILVPKNPEVNIKYAFYLMQTIRVGFNTHKRYWISEFSKQKILIPPKNIQQAIVFKIEELFSELDKGIENMRTAQQQLKTYRQAVLKWAFEGFFTKDWRKKNSNEKLAEVIIKQVLIEKEKIVKSNGLRLPVFEVVDKEELLLLPQLPNSWTWITPDVISSPEKYSIGIGPFGSNLKVSDYKTEGFPLVFVKNITRNDFTLNLKFISENKFRELNAHAIKPLDILITKMGDPPGDCAIYPANRPNAVITSDCLKFRVWDKFSNIKYFKYCLETNIIKKQLGLRTKGVAQKKISSSRFKTILFPFTNIEEQDEIVRQIESRLSVADKMEESITQSLKQAEALRQSILKKAFEGKLI